MVGFVDNFCWICRRNFLDFLTIFFGFVDEIFWIGFVDHIFWICQRICLDLSTKFFGFVNEFFLDLSIKFVGFFDDFVWICQRDFLDLSTIFLDFSLSDTSLRGSHGLSGRRARRTKSSRPEGPQTRSWGPEGP